MTTYVKDKVSEMERDALLDLISEGVHKGNMRTFWITLAITGGGFVGFLLIAAAIRGFTMM